MKITTTIAALVFLFSLVALICGCGAEPYDDTTEPVAYSTTGGVCYQETSWRFSADICPGRVDIGLCSFAIDDGRTLHPVGCITQHGVTCVASCAGL